MKNKDSNIDIKNIPGVSFGATTIIRQLPFQSDRTDFPSSFEDLKKLLNKKNINLDPK